MSLVETPPRVLPHCLAIHSEEPDDGDNLRDDFVLDGRDDGMTIDWSRPLMTNAGKPARERGVHDEWGGLPTMLVDIPETDDCFYFFNDGTSYGDGKHIKLRNATPAEILANPDVWPEHQDWARENAVMMQGPATYAKANPQPRDWLTPETAIGCKLPCGATVVKARKDSDGVVVVSFDREPQKPGDIFQFDTVFLRNGRHYAETLPNLIPPPPTDGVLVTREMLREKLRLNEAMTSEIADALGLPPDPPKVAPWEEAFDRWPGATSIEGAPRQGFEAGAMWALGEACDAVNIGGPNYAIETAIRRRIMGNDA